MFEVFAVRQVIPFDKVKRNLLIGEKTPTYSYKKECAQKIFNYSKELKLIWILTKITD